MNKFERDEFHAAIYEYFKWLLKREDEKEVPDASAKTNRRAKPIISDYNKVLQVLSDEWDMKAERRYREFRDYGAIQEDATARNGNVTDLELRYHGKEESVLVTTRSLKQTVASLEEQKVHLEEKIEKLIAEAKDARYAAIKASLDLAADEKKLWADERKLWEDERKLWADERKTWEARKKEKAPVHAKKVPVFLGAPVAPVAGYKRKDAPDIAVEQPKKKEPTKEQLRIRELQKLKTSQSAKLKRMQTKLQKVEEQKKVLAGHVMKLAEPVMAAQQPPAAPLTFTPLLPTLPWEEWYEKLKDFHAGHGHCRVKQRADGMQGRLGRWVASQRKNRRAVEEDKAANDGKRVRTIHNALSDERIKLLDDLAFEWYHLKTPAVPWQDRYNQLVAFKEEHGHTSVPRNNKELGEWVHCQRGAYRNKTRSLLGERMQLLNAIGFEWVSAQQGVKYTFEERFQQILNFRRKHGHLDIPKPNHNPRVRKVGNEEPEPKVDKNSEEYTEQAFFRWVARLRHDYHTKFARGRKTESSLDGKKVARLNEIAFVWGDVPITYALSNKPKLPKEEIWTIRLAELIQYKHDYGDYNVPANYPTNKQLGIWVSEQRKQNNKRLRGIQVSLTDERIERLDAIGFNWFVRYGQTKLGREEKARQAEVDKASGDEDSSL